MCLVLELNLKSSSVVACLWYVWVRYNLETSRCVYPVCVCVYQILLHIWCARLNSHLPDRQAESSQVLCACVCLFPLDLSDHPVSRCCFDLSLSQIWESALLMFFLPHSQQGPKETNACLSIHVGDIWQRVNGGFSLPADFGDLLTFLLVLPSGHVFTFTQEKIYYKLLIIFILCLMVPRRWDSYHFTISMSFSIAPSLGQNVALKMCVNLIVDFAVREYTLL